ncbi:type II toxin-antitoxin system RelE/ParE family toxin [Natronogracilivirga saccharolytica]|uniref:Type II toxin-antitoxin system RelE/ParE family toxin n=1 Tax=Natronogracilivirga saccharolytica TaxID=2812953 RepID=A0A8J7RTJ2_9BACT|nr:type II toxin-antitoxin system RelE/ParE family toxin [Natronogracilivirga saccharolytica]MBP3192717.1 type II toxin-antitoxin system RelE/ParE family toxin [Natronogracilivirga saccharolytica]
MKIIWSPLSLQKLDYYADYIARDNIDAALAFIDEVEDKALSLKDHPLKGRMIPTLNDEMKRELIIKGNYLLIYEIGDDLIEILTIRHVKQKPK